MRFLTLLRRVTSVSLLLLVSIRKLHIVILSGAKNLPESPGPRDSSSPRPSGTPQNDSRKESFRMDTSSCEYHSIMGLQLVWNLVSFLTDRNMEPGRRSAPAYVFAQILADGMLNRRISNKEFWISKLSFYISAVLRFLVLLFDISVLMVRTLHVKYCIARLEHAWDYA